MTSHFTTTMDHNTESTIIEIVKRPKGRPRRETPLADEETKQRAREIAKRHYEQNYDYRRSQKQCHYERTKQLNTNILKTA